CQQYTNAPFSF
nr:immunoglobulin light chain junction region [Macaca mulatta]